MTTFPTFVISYTHEGAEWGIELKARDAEDAKARLKRIAYGSVDGILIGRAPWYLGPFLKLAVALQNWGKTP